MKKSESIKRNYIYNTIYQLLVIATPLITAPYVSRVFGADIIGLHSYTSSILTYFTLFAALGTNSYGQREIARNRDNKNKMSNTFWEIEIMSVLVTTISLISWMIFIFSSDGQLRNYYIVHTISIVSVAFDITWLFSGLERFKEIVLRNSITRIIGVILLFILIRTKEDIFIYILLWGSVTLISFISLWPLLPKYVDKPDLKSISIIPHLKKTFVYFVPTIATSIYTVLDKTMIGVITNDSFANGYYEQGEKIVKMVQTVLLSLNTVMYSRMSYLISIQKKNEVREKLNKSVDYLLFLSIPMCFGLMGISEKFVPWFFGAGYEPVAKLINIFSPLLIIIAISNCLVNQYLNPVGKRKDANKAIIIGAIVNFGINLLAIPKYNYYGAAVASVISEFIITILIFKLCDSMVKLSTLLLTIIKRVPSSIVMYVVVRMIGNHLEANLFTTLIQIFSGGIVFLVISYMFKDNLIIEFFHKFKKIKKII